MQKSIIKQIPEDFVVEEIPIKMPEIHGDYAIVNVTKKDRNTEDIAIEISNALSIPRKSVGYAGTKDRNALTSQYYSIKTRLQKDSLLNYLKNLKNVGIDYCGRQETPLSLGDLKANRFTIIIRNLESFSPEIFPVPNYFDEQRFSSSNAEIGKLIIKKDYQNAAKKAIASQRIDAEALTRFEKNDYIGALRLIPRNILKMYLHAYQSLLYNETVTKYLEQYNCKTIKYSRGIMRFPRQDIKDVPVPMIGFGMPCSDNAQVESCVDKIMKSHKLDKRHFIIHQMPDLSLEGETRSLLVDMSELKISDLERDELNLGKYKVKLCFVLKPGSYATVVIKSL